MQWLTSKPIHERTEIQRSQSRKVMERNAIKHANENPLQIHSKLLQDAPAPI